MKDFAGILEQKKTKIGLGVFYVNVFKDLETKNCHLINILCKFISKL